MRYSLVIFVFILALCSNCKRKGFIDSKGIDSLISVTDSLLSTVQKQSDYTSGNFYLLIDDTLKIDSLRQSIGIPDSLGIYQFIELNINDFNEFIAETNSEIFFAKDQLKSLKIDISIMTKSEFLIEFNQVREMISFLKERVDSNIYVIDSRYNEVFFSNKDIIQ